MVHLHCNLINIWFPIFSSLTEPIKTAEADGIGTNGIGTNGNASNVTNGAEAYKERHECVKAHKAILEKSFKNQMTF